MKLAAHWVADLDFVKAELRVALRAVLKVSPRDGKKVDDLDKKRAVQSVGWLVAATANLSDYFSVEW